jgi:hypothetical protein
MVSMVGRGFVDNLDEEDRINNEEESIKRWREWVCLDISENRMIIGIGWIRKNVDVAMV